MPPSLAWTTLGIVLAALLLGNLVKGVAGFGYAPSFPIATRRPGR